MKLLTVGAFALLVATPPPDEVLSDEARVCLRSGECVIVREMDLKNFIDQIRQQADAKIWCRNA